MEESVLVLVKAVPTWSREHGEFIICTAGINEAGEWRRLYPIPREMILKGDIKVWDIIKVKVTDPIKDPRPESRKIKPDSIKNMGCAIKDREEKRKYLEQRTDPSFDLPNEKKRTLALIKPTILDFEIEKRKQTDVQKTLDGKIFREHPYGDFGLYYTFNCEKPCTVCAKHPHRMECFDWGANVLYRKYPDEDEAVEKVRDMCYVRMKTDFDVWFAIGTHSSYPFLKWLLTGLLWMKRKEPTV